MVFPYHRLRRLRQTQVMRELVRESRLATEMLVYPIFVDELAKKPECIDAMPGQYRWPKDLIGKPVEKALQKGIKTFLLFGVPENKDSHGSSSRDETGVVPTAVRFLKKEFPGIIIITDVCLCAYTDHGHCGIIDGSSGQVLNDESLPLIAEMALVHARAGADIVAPSDMMDGRIAAIRARLDGEGFSNTAILSYAAKFASNYYGPFREAAHSAPQFGDRKGYQIDPANARQALFELELDFEEGADILMVKPAMPYLDIIRQARDAFPCPIAAYQVSGEYSMIKAAAKNGWIDERSVVLESLSCIHRAGADIILTYFAPEAAEWLK